jgi:hypothetical protein
MGALESMSMLRCQPKGRLKDPGDDAELLSLYSKEVVL